MINPHASLPVEDSSAPFEHFAKNGYYVVNNKVYMHHIRAMQEASRTKSQIKWHFNDLEYSALDWQKPLGVPLEQLYKARALQLRQKYDYLILAVSGGADSTTILDVFLDNNIKLDEVVHYKSSKSEGNYVPDPTSTDPRNFMSEWDYVLKPQLDLLAKKYPDIKITIADHELSKNEFNDDTATVGEMTSFIAINRARGLDHVLRSRYEQHKNLAYIMGVAPPNLSIINNVVYVDFLDAYTTSTFKSDYSSLGFLRNIEFFYWTPDFPEIVREQAHALFKTMLANPDVRQLYKTITQDPVTKSIEASWPEDPNELRRHMKTVIYPRYSLKLLQVDKLTDMLNRPIWSSWFYANPHSEEYLVPWRSAMKSEYALIDPKYLIYADQLGSTHDIIVEQGMPVRFKSTNSRFYKIGTLPT